MISSLWVSLRQHAFCGPRPVRWGRGGWGRGGAPEGRRHPHARSAVTYATDVSKTVRQFSWNGRRGPFLTPSERGNPAQPRQRFVSSQSHIYIISPPVKWHGVAVTLWSFGSPPQGTDRIAREEPHAARVGDDLAHMRDTSCPQRRGTAGSRETMSGKLQVGKWPGHNRTQRFELICSIELARVCTNVTPRATTSFPQCLRKSGCEAHGLWLRLSWKQKMERKGCVCSIL